MWSGNLEGARLSKGGGHRPYQGFANPGLWAKPSPQAVSVSPVILESSHAQLCVHCPWLPLPCHGRAPETLLVWPMTLTDSGSPLLKSSVPQSFSWGTHVYPLWFGRSCHRALGSSQLCAEGCGGAPSRVYDGAELVVCLEGSPGVPISPDAHTSVLCLLLWPSLNSCGTSWLAGSVNHLGHHTSSGCAGNNGI